MANDSRNQGSSESPNDSPNAGAAESPNQGPIGSAGGSPSQGPSGSSSPGPNQGQSRLQTLLADLNQRLSQGRERLQAELAGPNRTRVLLAGLGILAVLFIGLWLLVDTDEPPPPPVATLPEPEPEPKPEPQPEPEPEPKMAAEPEPAKKEEPSIVLPLLDESDDMVRDGFVAFTRHSGAGAWLSVSDLVRRFVAAVDSLATGKVPAEAAHILAPVTPFQAQETGAARYEMTPATYERYNGFVDVVASMDARRAADFYRLLQPLFQTAYQELGYGPQQSFTDAVYRALQSIQETPVLSGPIQLVRPKVRYEFADPALESRSDLQKQLLRMGPRNGRLLQRKAGELTLELQRALAGG